MAENIWKEIKNQFEFVELDQFIVMPNHIHWIIVIAQNQDAINRVSTTKNGDIGGTTGLSNPMLQENLWKIIRWYKWRCSFELRKIRDDFFSWQSNYHERIIRTESELQKIRQYIYDNPANWQTDEENISPTS
jgi:REP element-mobilizing transposase RayT